MSFILSSKLAKLTISKLTIVYKAYETHLSVSDLDAGTQVGQAYETKQ